MNDVFKIANGHSGEEQKRQGCSGSDTRLSLLQWNGSGSDLVFGHFCKWPCSLFLRVLSPPLPSLFPIVRIKVKALFYLNDQNQLRRRAEIVLEKVKVIAEKMKLLISAHVQLPYQSKCNSCSSVSVNTNVALRSTIHSISIQFRVRIQIVCQRKAI